MRSASALVALTLTTSALAVERGYAPVNGPKLYYELHGPSDSAEVPLVLLHGGGSTLDTSFSRLLPLLAKTRRVIAFDQQGHGRTADVDRPFSFEQSAEDAVALLRHLGIRRADFLGYSNGGQIAVAIALSHPEVVRALILQSAMLTRDGAPPGFFDGFAHARFEDMPESLQQEYRAKSPHPDRLRSFFDKSVQRMRDFKGWTPAQLKTIRAPTLMLLGDRDVVTVEHAAQVPKWIAGAQVAVLPGTDHLAMTERAEWVAPLVEAFLRGAGR